MTIYYAQTSGTQQTNSAQPTPIPGLTVTVPEGVGITALVILNLPNPYAQGNNYPGGMFGIDVGGAALPVVASFTYNDQQPASSGRIPTTLVCQVPLVNNPQVVTATWQGIRGSTVIIDTPATLSAIVA